jgi:hypothetical protein
MSENHENGRPEHGRVNGAGSGDAGREAAGSGAASGERDPGARGSGGPPRDPIGSVAEEAMKLFDALQERVMRELGKGVVRGGARAGMSGLGQALGGRSAPKDVWGEVIAEAEHEEPEYICRACPICRVKAASRESGGDVADHLVAAGGELVAAFRQVFEALQRPASGGGSRERERRPRPSRVEHIDLG